MTKETISDFMSLEHFSLKTGVPKAHIKWLISKRKSNGAHFFLNTIGPENTWMVSPSRFLEWKYTKLEETNEGRN